MKKTVILFAIIAALALSLSACGKKTASEIKTPADEPQVTEDAQTPAENGGQAESSETGETEETAAARQDGERFEDVIILEGMEETVHYEHVRNDEIGFEMDYDYELFVRHSEADREWFVSVWDDPDNPENYIEVKYNPQDAESIAESIGALLSNNYDISRNDSFALESAGSCIRIDASADVGGLTMPDHLQMVYIIPADDGCRVATAHYAIEASEGFGRRFHYFMDTFSAITGRAEKRMSDEQAVSAIRNYCFINNPDLEKYVNSGDSPVYWDISSSDGKEIVVVFRSYTGSVNRYYIDPVSGETYVTERVPGIKDEEGRTSETMNAWDYSF